MTAHRPAQNSTGLGLSTARSLRDLRVPILAGVAIGVLQALTPFAFWWLPAATVYAMGVAVIAAVYIGFSVADGRPRVIAVETAVATLFLVVAAAGVTGTAWLLVAGLTGHGVKDYWQHRTHFVANTRWWPPFCATVDIVVSTILAVALVAGADLTG
ncbi:MAG TPA: hypothetical protein VFT70_10230 [Nocardioides sp.]|nr:hypothetical protein [Nocardioides sp.]